ncbi:MAG: DNA polymerase III subunit beta [Oscillospiraceae bacterium]|nr:DNA polymerase III subunit beta [Oscillospiraceae bacterium]
MILTCDTSLLSSCVQHAQKAVSSRNTLPVLEGVFLQASGEKLTVTGFDMEIGITKEMPCACKEEGKLVLNARMFGEMIKNLDVSTVTIENTDSFVVKISGGKTEYTMLGLDANDYPVLPVFETEREVELPQYLLKHMIRQTIFSVGQNENKPIQTGILFEIKDGVLSMVSCDGCRIAVCKEKVEMDKDIKIIIPGRTMNELARMLSDEEEEKITVCAGKKHVCFTFGSCKMISRLLEGNFIDYNAAVPKNENTVVRVKTKDLMRSIDRTSLILTERTKSSVRFLMENNMIRTDCQTGLGHATDEIAADVQGERVKIGFNAKFISDALRAYEADEVILKLSGSLNPLRILPVEGDSFLYLVMPVRMKED